MEVPKGKRFYVFGGQRGGQGSMGFRGSGWQEVRWEEGEVVTGAPRTPAELDSVLSVMGNAEGLKNKAGFLDNIL